jgi:hypothetical protein
MVAIRVRDIDVPVVVAEDLAGDPRGLVSFPRAAVLPDVGRVIGDGPARDRERVIVVLCGEGVSNDPRKRLSQ